MHTPPLHDAVAAIARDRQAGRLDRWSWSTVIDENVGEAVIEREVFARIHESGDIDAAFPIGNAGLVHVYGYLFSSVVTPYGYKSDRWNDGVLASSLGLPADHFQLGASDDETPLERVLGAAMPLLTDPPASARLESWRVDDVEQRAVLTDGALISGLDDGSGLRLLTIFPVADANAFARDLTEDPPRLRWNAARTPRT
ncbi:MAG: amino acid deaminase [Microbacterium gubbeenense]|uniref:hypothetical protein n=1 Tax=Microbacterium gubbeenense TaxID=159896 RepID=UPI000683DD8C|nr:hypothetical protein [Microbacterium gubbeenense]